MVQLEISDASSTLYVCVSMHGACICRSIPILNNQFSSFHPLSLFDQLPMITLHFVAYVYDATAV